MKFGTVYVAVQDGKALADVRLGVQGIVQEYEYLRDVALPKLQANGLADINFFRRPAWYKDTGKELTMQEFIEKFGVSTEGE